MSMSPEINQPSHLIGSSAARACEKQQKSFTVVTSFVVKERKSVGQGDYLVHSRVEHLSAIDPSQSSRSDAICVTRVYTASDLSLIHI